MLKLVFEFSEISNDLFSFCGNSRLSRFRGCPMNIVNALGLAISVFFGLTDWGNLTRMTGHRSLAEG